MDEVLLQDYELSIWETYVPEDSATGNFEERKVAVIGSPTIHSNTSAYNVAIKENINGEKTLTFSLARKYRNDEGELVDNPFLSLLSAERIVKLRDGEAYEMTGDTPEDEIQSLEEEDIDERWKDFVIKNIDENSSTYVNSYTCKEVFVNELGKNGWSTVLDTELGNNYGTVIELGETILQGSGWKVSEDSYNPTARLDEQLFVVSVDEKFNSESPLVAENTLSKESSEISSGYLYFFYSDVEIGKTEDGERAWKVSDKNAVEGKVQFMWPGKGIECFTADMADDNNVIIDETDKFNFDCDSSAVIGLKVVPVGDFYDPTQSGRALLGGRIVKSVNSHFEPVADRYVEDWEVKGTEEKVYHYQETEYATSDIVQNYLANSTNFVSQIGWVNRSTNAGSITDGFQFHTMPIPEEPPLDITTVKDWLPTNYMVLPKGSNEYKYHNSGLSDQHIRLVKDKIYVFRWRARVIDETANSYTVDSLPIPSTSSTSSTYGNSVTVKLVYQDSTSGTLQYTGASNEVTASNFTRNNTTPTDNDNLRGYPVPVASQTGRTAYSEAAVGRLYMDEQGYAYCFLKANHSTKAFGEDAFLELKMAPSSSYPNYKWHVQDIQFFEYKEQTVDNKTIPIFPGDIPTASMITNDVFYRVINGNAGKEVEFLSSNTDLYTPIRKEGYTAVRHLEVKESNYFNNISSLAELFEVWVKFKVRHKKNGALLLDDTGMPIKEVVFSRFAPGSKENYAGFRYGVNLKNIKRNITSQNIATKLIVKDNNNEFATDGMCSIRRASDNPTGENIIFNFDYYINQGLVDYTQLLKDLYGLTDTDLGYNWRMKQLNDEMLPLSERLVECQGQIQSAEEMIEYAETSIESVQSELLWQQQIYNSYAGANIGDGTQEIKLSTVAQLQAQLIAFEKSLETYQSQIKYYNGLIYGQEIGGSTLEYKGLWKKNENYGKNAVVSISNNYDLRAFRSTQDANKDEPGVSSSSTWVEITDNVEQMGLADRVTYYGDRKQQLNLAFFHKYHRYIQEGTWTNEQYIDDNLYYFDAQKVSSQSAYPKTTYTIGVIDIQGNLSYAPYHFDIGDRTYVEDTEFFGYTYNTIVLDDNTTDTVKTPFKKQVIVSERTRNFDDPSKSTITIQTYKNQFEELFSKITATTQSLQYASGGYDRAASVVKPNGEIEITTLENAFANNAWILANSKNQSVTWDSGLGIVVTDKTNSSVAVRITSNGIMMTTDGGRTWINGITGVGINTRYLLAGQIDASNINIIGDSVGYAFKWDANGISAFDEIHMLDDDTSQTRYVRFNRYGIFGTTTGSDLEIAMSSLGSDATIQNYLDVIEKNSNFALTWNGLSLRAKEGGISLTPVKGLEVFGPGTSDSTDWYFPKSTVDNDSGVNYPYIYDPNGILYTTEDLIPLVSVGKFRYELNENGPAYYGLQMRNKEGFITLRTDNNGNLWLANTLSIGDTDPYDTSVRNEERIYIIRNTDSITFTLPIITENLDVSQGIICLDTATVATNSGTIQITATTAEGDVNATTITITPATVFDMDEEEINNGVYRIAYYEKISQYRYLCIDGSTDAYFRTETGGETGESVNLNPLILYAGNTIGNEAPFKVYSNGDLIATSATISGIINAYSGNFTGTISVGNSSGINGSSTAPYAFWAGDINPDLEPNFFVTPQGHMDVQSAYIHGNSTFEGTIYANNGSFSGSIEAREGRINRLYINDSDSYIGTGNGTGSEKPDPITLSESINAIETSVQIEADEGSTTTITRYLYPIPNEYVEKWGYVTKASVFYNNKTLEINCDGVNFYEDGTSSFNEVLNLGSVITPTENSVYIETRDSDLFFNINDGAFGVNAAGHYFGNLAALVPNANWFNYVGVVNANAVPSTTTAFIEMFEFTPEIKMKLVVEGGTSETIGENNRTVQEITNIDVNGNITYEERSLADDQLTRPLAPLNNRWSKYNILFGENVYEDYIMNIFSPAIRLDESGTEIEELPQSNRIFGIKTDGSVEISGTLTTQGDLLFGGKLVSTSRNLVIDGVNGSIYSDAGWWLNESGNAQFNNVTISGEIQSAVFAYDHISAIGGKIMISPVLHLTDSTSGTDNGDVYKFNISITDNQSALWEKVTEIFINIPNTGSSGTITLDGNDSSGISASIINDKILEFEIPKSDLSESDGILPAGTQIISQSTNTNSIVLSAEDPNGSNIIIKGKGADSTSDSLVMLGFLDPVKLDNQTRLDFSELASSNPTYGLFANNAFITGQVRLPNAGITNENTVISEDWDNPNEDGSNDPSDEKDASCIRFWAGAPNNSDDSDGTIKRDISKANFIVTQDGTLYAQNGIFKGRVNAQNSDFSGFVRATGIILGEQSGDTNYSHFYFQWEDDVWGKDIAPSIPKYIMDINRYGLNIWQGGINVFSDYYSLDSQRNGNFYGWEAPVDAEDGYWPESNAPWPIFTILDKINANEDGSNDSEDTEFIPRISLTDLQIWKAESKTASEVFGISANSKEIKFQHLPQQLSSSNEYGIIADNLIEQTPYMSIGNHNGNIGLQGTNISIYDAEGNKAISFMPGAALSATEAENTSSVVRNTSTVEIFGNTKFTEVMQIEQLADGLVFTYIGE